MNEKVSVLDRIWNLVFANFGTKLVSIIIAFVLWGIVLGSRNVEVTKEIPLEVVTAPNVVPANEIPDKISFRLSGPKAFLRSILDRREDPIRVDLSGGKPALVTYRFFSDNIHLPIGVKVLSINPTAILIKLEYLKHKDIPVRVEVRGGPAEGYRVVKTEVKPEVVQISGAESRVDSISEISTVPIDISGLKKTIEKEIPIDFARYNVHLDSQFPRVRVEIEPLAANFRIKNVDIHVLSSYKVKLVEKTVTVLVRASAQDIQNLDRTQVFGVVDMSGKGRGRYREPVKVTLPRNIDLVKVLPDHVNLALY